MREVDRGTHYPLTPSTHFHFLHHEREREVEVKYYRTQGRERTELGQESQESLKCELGLLKMSVQTSRILRNFSVHRSHLS